MKCDKRASLALSLIARFVLVFGVALLGGPARAQLLSEGFNDINTLVPSGWVRQNNSSPVGSTAWFQGNESVFVAQSGPQTSYIAANFNNTTTAGTISNWLLTPVLTLQNGTMLKFWTRTTGIPPVPPDRLQVRMSLAGSSANVGATATSVGDFTTLLLDINPLYSGANYPTGYPFSWTEFTITLSGIGSPTSGRLAFRYFVENGGPGAARSNYIGIDTVSVIPPSPCQRLLPNCSADIAPGGAPNGMVNVDDLLAVINTWGVIGPPRPQGDCAPLPSGDCKVNVDDLLGVINGWGLCAAPKGACCLPNGTCSTISNAQCLAGQGFYYGDNSQCSLVTCVVAPSNDNCAGAATISTGLTSINNANAYNSLDAAPGCVSTGDMTRDLWYTFTAKCTGTLLVDTCSTPTGSAVTDTVLAIYGGSCGSLVELACNDDGCDDLSLMSKAQAAVTSGQQVFIRVGSFAGTDGGAISLSVACLSNDDCLGAEALTIGSTVSNTLANTNQDFAPDCSGTCGSPAQPCTIQAGFGRWYTVIGNGTTLTASTCTSPNQLWDARISVFCGVDCDNLSCAIAINTNSCAGFHETLSWCAAIGQKYWILVHAPSDPAPNGNYTLSVTSNGVTGCTPIPCGVSNDECAGAINVLNGVNDITNAGATTSGGIPGGACAAGGAANFTRDVWYRYIPTFTGNVQIDTCATTGDVNDTVLSLFSGNCNTLIETACNDDFCLAKSRAVAPVTVNVPIYIRVGSWKSSNDGPMKLTIGQFNGVPNDDCPTATVITAVPFSTTFNNSTAAPGGVPALAGSCNSPGAQTIGMQNDVWFKYTPPTNCTMTVTWHNHASYTTIIVIRQGADCSNLSEVFCKVENASVNPHSTVINAIGGTSYWFQIGDQGVNPGGGATDFSVSCQ